MINVIDLLKNPLNRKFGSQHFVKLLQYTENRLFVAK
ncbi:MAG: hypothetical protein JG782_1455 [Anaerophaga sp.]|nr:hypothetical protein [Anaerophaga sp.]MDK2840884.1 hypothetical protein [Anaerophaga sp.]MDN5290841.1 hypothetical protein [Anaerophaga sp.]